MEIKAEKEFGFIVEHPDKGLMVCLTLSEFAQLTDDIKEELITDWYTLSVDQFVDSANDLFIEQEKDFIIANAIKDWEFTYDYTQIQCDEIEINGTQYRGWSLILGIMLDTDHPDGAKIMAFMQLFHDFFEAHTSWDRTEIEASLSQFRYTADGASYDLR